MSPKNSDISQDEFERIERYILQDMSVEELDVFEKKLKVNPELQALVTEHELLFSAIEEETLSEKLDEFHKDLPAQETPVVEISRKKTAFSKYAIAATVILFLSIGSIWFFSRTMPHESLFAKHFTPDPGLPTTMSQTDNYDFYDAMVQYKQGDYKTAIAKWEALVAKQPENDTLYYFLGVAHLANENENAAIKYLDVVIQSNRETFKNDAYYYLGLAHLKNNNLKLSEKNFSNSTISNSKILLSELDD